MTGTDIAMPVLEGDRVLVVEDGEDAAAALTALLRLHGFNARQVGTAAAALSVTRVGKPRVVILDLGLPDADGLVLLRRLRAFRNAPAVIVVTGHAGPAHRQAAEDAGAFAYLVKPTDPDELVPLVRRLCEQVVARA